ncbi:putative nepenthesin [Lupinus albus]|uniref:Putative nepenthesin n=1 Tax=Lupinus albus TaxID=3870 RepID=A0A6A4R2N0_LUPAL|nr:putative nepenthesin [Lupinus albus]
MRFCLTTLLAIATTVAVAVAPVSVVYSFILPLERAVPVSHRVELESLRAHDMARHARILRGVAGGVVDFSVQGTSDPNALVGYGLYFTKVKMGSPPKEFNVQIDTGSDVLWVNCNTCSDCPQSSGLGIELSFFDTVRSSTVALVSCSDQICTSGVQGAAAQCSPQVNQCTYSFQYGDGSATSGYYVSDAMYFDMIMGHSSPVNSSATIVFGCSTHQSGDLTKSDKAVDGIFGFGPGALSVVSQLSSRGIIPKVFSHCLKGDSNGGGILVLGEIVEPSIVYSPLVPSQPHYNLNLQSISVNGQLLSINPAVFETSNNRGTIVDSGTTLAYLIQEAYDPLVTSITTTVSQLARPIISKGNQCYLVPTSVGDVFPFVSLNFVGGASMVLKPEQYLVHYGFLDSAAMWCIGFQKVQEGVTILGDLVLKDKILVYDLARQRIGWADYDCSLAVNVSVTTSKDEYINAGQVRSVSGLRIRILSRLLPASIMALSMHIVIFMKSPFL